MPVTRSRINDTIVVIKHPQGGQCCKKDVFSPVYLVVTALISGTALMVLVHYLKVRCRKQEFCADDRSYMFLLGKILALLLGILMFLMTWKFIVGIFQHQQATYDALMTLLTGPLAVNFWLCETILGMLIPFAIILTPSLRKPLGLTVASCLALFGMFFMRYDYVIAGQIVPLRDEGFAAPREILQYTPSLSAVGIIVGAFALCLFLYTLAEQYFDLEVRHSHAAVVTKVAGSDTVEIEEFDIEDVGFSG